MSDTQERLSLLFDTHEDKLYRLARRLTRAADEAEDLLQDTFLKAAQSLASVPEAQGPAEAWLVRVMVNTRRDQWRRTAVRRKAAPIVFATTAASPPTPESTLITRRTVWAALDTLAPRRRAIVVLAELDGLSPLAIAAMLGIAIMTVRWHLALGRRELRRLLAPHMRETTHEDTDPTPARRRSVPL